MSEMLEKLSDYGITEGIVSRDEAHSKGLLHRISLVAIINSDNRILLQHRSAAKKLYPGTWDISIAAHVLAGEDSVATAMRETNEEIGVQIERKVQAKDFRFLTSFREDLHLPDRTEKHWYDLFALIRDIDAKDFRFNDSEVDEIMWASYTDIQKLKERGGLFPRTNWIDPVFKLINKL
ncbi:MAG: NUDIX domain-containing protein [Lactobacillaceae bacterium]|jgi:isopentenyldiphosphate isomerase|nr:NUDIX domain-containing protein [Lactobacillaceae bacterium]